MKLLAPLATSILAPLLITSPVRAALPFSDPVATSQIRISVVDREAGSVPAGSMAVKGFTVLVADSAGTPVSDSAVVFRFPDDGPTASFPDASHSAIVYTSSDGLARISGIKWGDTPGSVAIKILATKGDARAGILLVEVLSAKTAEPLTTSQPVPAVKDQPLLAPAASTPVPVPAPGVSSPTPAPLAKTAVADKPVLPRPADVPPSVAEPPVVSVTNGKTAQSGYHSSSHKKWIIIAAVVVAAAGAGIAMGSKGKSSSTASTSGVSVGSPSVSVGQP